MRKIMKLLCFTASLLVLGCTGCGESPSSATTTDPTSDPTTSIDPTTVEPTSVETTSEVTTVEPTTSITSEDTLDPIDTEPSKDDRSYAEMFRPQYHWSDPDSWLNDPNGLVYADGVWHMYYQACPHTTGNGKKYWGHATSTDLVHWEFQGYPLVPDRVGDMWSGSCAADPKNLSGFFDDCEQTGIIAAYSTHTQKVGVAYSTDGGMTFEKIDDSRPLIDNKGARDFRDPCLFYYPEDGMWKIALAGGQLRIFESADLVEWEECSVNTTINTECPCLFRITTEDTQEEKWVLTCSSRGYYVGSFDGYEFRPETPYIPMNDTPDSYAGIIFSDAPNNRVIMLNWMQNISGNYMNAEGRWSQQMTLPIEFKLYTDGKTGYRLRQNAVSELNNNRVAALKEIKNQMATETLLDDVKSNTFEMDLTIDLAKTTDQTFTVSLGRDNLGTDEVNITFNKDTNRLSFDRSKNKYGFDNMTKSNNKYSASISPTSIIDNKLKLHIYFDVSCLEVFVNDGYHYCPFKFNTFTSSRSMKILGNAFIDNLNIYEMGSSFFHHKENIDGVHIADESTIYVELGKTIKREVASFNGKPLTVKSGDESLFAASMDDSSNLVIEGKKLGTSKVTVSSGMRYKELSVMVYDGSSQAENMLGEMDVSNAQITYTPFSVELTGFGGDGFAFSKVKGSNFTYSADVTIKQGTAAALLFRANGSSNFYCFNFDTGGKFFKLWKRVNGQFTDLKIINDSSIAVNKEYALKVETNGSNIKCYINGELKIDVNDTSHISGYLGLNVFNAKAAFNNLFYSGDAKKNDAVVNKITGLGTMECSSCQTLEENGVVTINNMGGGDCFAISDLIKDNFTISADFKVPSGGALAYLLRVQDLNNFYCMNIDRTESIVKFWKRVNGVATVVQTTRITPSNDFVNFKVKLDGSNVEIFYNEASVISVSDTSFKTGYVGFNAFRTSGEFKNLKIS